MSVGSSFGVWIVTLFPELDLPEQLLHVDDAVNDILAMGDGLGAWVDWTYIGLVAAIPASMWALGLLVRAFRAILAHVPFVGGKG